MLAAAEQMALMGAYRGCGAAESGTRTWSEGALRAPVPGDTDRRGLATIRAKTSHFLGVPGDDRPLGRSNHRAARNRVALDGETRFRHTYIIGQTTLPSI